MNKKGFDFLEITGLIIAGIILIGGLYLSTQFIDYPKQLENSSNTTGQITLNEDNFDEIQDNIDDFMEEAIIGYMIEDMINTLLPWAIALVVILIALIVFLILFK